MKIHNHKTKTLVSYILLTFTLLCTLAVSLYFDTQEASAATSTQTGCITYGSSGVYFRKTPGGEQIRDNGNIIMLNGGHPLEILDTSNSAWYRVRLTYNGTSYTGYVASQYVFFSSSSASSDAEFEKMIEGFPESYKPQLRELHKKHPKWIFNPINTGLDWNTVIANEVNTSKEVKNTVEGTSSYPRYNWRSTTVGYDYTTDKYKAYDGSTWFAASDALVTFYLDPRIYLSEKNIFAFEALTYDPAQTTEGVEAILNGSFMYKNKPADSTSTYSTLMVQAGKAAGISPYHIASRIRQEVGSTNGSVTNGKHSKYPGIYNFYNIGAYDSSSGDAPTLALQWASQKNATYGRPWNSVYKSLYGGALYIGEKYIFKGQNTLYTQKFNVTNKSDGLYSHQYMTNVQAVESEAAKVYTAYSGANMLDNPIVFLIPVYNNMPSTISIKPEDSGSPNNWLKTLTVSGCTFNFNPATTNYTFSVPASVSSITIGATTVNSNAKISGTGTISLKAGTNTINIVVTAQNGSKRTYTLTVSRDSDPTPDVVKNLKTTSGDKSITVSWDAVSGADGYRVYRYDNAQKTWIRIATISSCSYKDTGLTSGATYQYAVRAYRTVNGTTYLSPTYPTKKGIANLANVTSLTLSPDTDKVTVSWAKIENADGYRVYRYNTTKKDWDRLTETTSTSYIDTARNVATTYQYTVRAYKVVDGTTYLSPSFSAFTTSTLPAVVKNMKTTPGDKSVTVSWDAVSGADGYRFYRYDSTQQKWNWIATTPSCSYKDTGLSAGATYLYAVRAYRTVNGTTYLSPTYPTKKGIANLANVTSLTLTPGTDSVTISWNKIANAGGYRVYRYNQTAKAWDKLTETTSTTYTDTGRSAGTSYLYTVRAYKVVDDITYLSPSYSQFMTSTLPAVVKNMKTTPGDKSVTVSWDAVSGADGYRFYRYDSTQQKWNWIATTPSCSYKDTGLSAGATYLYAVRAYRTVNGTTYLSPTYPTKKGIANLANITSLTLTPGTDSVTISWNKIANAGGYRVYRYNQVAKAWDKLTETTSTTYTDTGRSAGTSYLYTVRAYKVVDDTTYLSPSYSQFMTSTLPAVVKNMKTTPGDKSVTVSWDAVSGADGYRFYRYDSTQQKWNWIATTSSCSYKDTGLSAGATYLYAVRAYRTVNGTTYLSPTYPTKKGIANLANVTSLTLTPGTDSVTISWNKIANAGGYRVYRYNQAAKAWDKLTETTSTTYTDTGLSAGTSYLYTVRAYKVVDDITYLSPSYSNFATSTNPASVNFKITAGSNQATVSWDKVSGATSYRVYYRTSSNESWQSLTETSGTSYTKTGLTKGKTYYFTVRAIKTYNGKTYMSSYSSKSIIIN